MAFPDWTLNNSLILDAPKAVEDEEYFITVLKAHPNIKMGWGDVKNTGGIWYVPVFLYTITRTTGGEVTFLRTPDRTFLFDTDLPDIPSLLPALAAVEFPEPRAVEAIVKKERLPKPGKPGKPKPPDAPIPVPPPMPPTGGEIPPEL